MQVSAGMSDPFMRWNSSPELLVQFLLVLLAFLLQWRQKGELLTKKISQLANDVDNQELSKCQHFICCCRCAFTSSLTWYALSSAKEILRLQNELSQLAKLQKDKESLEAQLKGGKTQQNSLLLFVLQR